MLGPTGLWVFMVRRGHYHQQLVLAFAQQRANFEGKGRTRPLVPARKHTIQVYQAAIVHRLKFEKRSPACCGELRNWREIEAEHPIAVFYPLSGPTVQFP